MSFFKKLKEKISKQTDTVTEKFKQGLEKREIHLRIK